MARRMGGFAAQQRTRDAFFNATLLVEQWNGVTGDCKRVDVFLKTEQTREFIRALIEDVEAETADGTEQSHGLSNTRKSGHLECADNQGDLHTTKKWYVENTDNQENIRTRKSGCLKGVDNQDDANTTKKWYLESSDGLSATAPNTSQKVGLDSLSKERLRLVVATSKARSDRGGGTWMHPLLFIKFAMWLNPRFEVKVLKFVRDKMLEYRDDAGEAYKALASAVARIVPEGRMREVMSTVARGINYVLWNAHSDGERNRHATDEEMRRLHGYERHLAATIDDGFIRSEEALLGHLRRQWRRKWDAARGPKTAAR